ncbi:MAG: class I SAM-dependent methyltransferase [Pirellulaceae bacterium]
MTEPLTWVDRGWRGLLRRQLASLRRGLVVFEDCDGTWQVGDRQSDCRATIRIRDPRVYGRLILGGDLGAAESFMDGDWTCDDLTQLVRVFVRNLDLAEAWNGGWGRLRHLAARVEHLLRANTRSGARRNIAAHYDLGNDFYRTFLDPTMNYSCGIFEMPHATLEQASLAKMERACRRLDLRPGQSLMEIGTGWGAFAMHAAMRYGVHITTTTISGEQWQVARERIDDAGLAGQVELLQQDYRDLSGQFDRLVSIEMVEAVGHEYLATYLEQCGRLLKPDGFMLLQAIVIQDARYERHVRSVDFMRKYIFPGGCLPSISRLTHTASAAADMRLVHLEDFSAHYAQTLRCWRSNFHRNLAAIRALGYDDRFLRMWDYYLAYCEAAFEERQVNLVQMLLAKREYRPEALQP